MDADALRKRIAELEQQEKQVWAQLNFICGAREECARLLVTLDTPAPAEPHIVRVQNGDHGSSGQP